VQGQVGCIAGFTRMNSYISSPETLILEILMKFKNFSGNSDAQPCQEILELNDQPLISFTTSIVRDSVHYN
jgi:hypothetical protein